MRKLFWVPICLALSAYLLLPLPGDSATLDERIQDKQQIVEEKREQEGAIASTIESFNTRIDGLAGEIAQTETRLNTVQGELDQRQAELEEVRDKLEVARDRLARARDKLAAGRVALADRLVELYKADEPDALTVVLEADGFADLLERTEFLQRISEQDGEIVERVRRLKEQAEREERQLAALETQRENVAEEVLARRNDIAAARDQLANAQGELLDERAGRRQALASVRNDRMAAQEDLASLEREQAQVQNALANPGAPPAGPIRQGSGSLIYPVNGVFTSPFGFRWGRLHAGIDLAAPTGTPIRAADSGNVVIAAYTGGYGNYICIQHTGSMSTCYGHLSSYATSAGANVSQGQVIGSVGNTGNSTGPHLHFEVRINGSPVDPMGYL